MFSTDILYILSGLHCTTITSVYNNNNTYHRLVLTKIAKIRVRTRIRIEIRILQATDLQLGPRLEYWVHDLSTPGTRLEFVQTTVTTTGSTT